LAAQEVWIFQSRRENLTDGGVVVPEEKLVLFVDVEEEGLVQSFSDQLAWRKVSAGL
jgi:hypothetical protein